MSLTINSPYNRLRDDFPYLRFYNTSNFTITLSDSADGVFKNKWNGDIYYSFDKITWSSVIGHAPITTNNIYFYGTDNNSVATNGNSIQIFISNGSAYCDGDVAYMLDLEKAVSGHEIIMPSYCFYRFFSNNSGLKSAPALPATTLANQCYSNMFNGCTSLTSAPALPATTLANNCYGNMFYGCTSLTSAPALPATTLTISCYNSMFYGCTSLVSAPALPATTLAISCYNNMFYGCTSLEIPPALPATDLYYSSCYSGIFWGSGINTIVKITAKRFGNYACSYMYRDTNVKLSQTRGGEYQYEFRIPSEGNVEILGNSPFMAMFSGTKGSFIGVPQIQTTYYTNKPLIE